MAETVSTERQDALAERLPSALRPLSRLAFNLWWSWQPGAEELWRGIDPVLWQHCGSNPVRLLREAPQRTLERAAADRATLDRADRLRRGLDELLSLPCAPAPPARPDAPVAFLCAEFGLHASLPIYSGGLGILAGDLLKEASDRCVPMVGVGLLYWRGYFHQRLDTSGWQHECWSVSTPEQLAVERAVDSSGAPVLVEVPIRGGRVRLAVWRVAVGRVPLFLLDADVPENDDLDRFITAQLYIGDPEYRLMQYTALGVGAVRALEAVGIEPAIFHLNEGHAALASLELLRAAVARGASRDAALAAVRQRLVFTTHTPVAAGNEAYPTQQVAAVMGPILGPSAAEQDALLGLGRPPGADARAPFGLTDLALRTSRSTNAVSRKHGEVARGMWAHHWPGRRAEEVPISHVTNGVHLPTWMALPMRDLLDRHLGTGWAAHAADPSRWSRLDGIPDAELWAVRNHLRGELVALARRRSVHDRLARGEPLGYAQQAARTLDPAVLTVGFARRVASYKRLDLLVADGRRALALLSGPRPLQVVIAGKAHPRDEGAKRMVQAVFALKHEPFAAARVVFVEDYDLTMAQQLVAGCDVWVNLPRPPLEASGTSGMKAALNGGVNLSVLDGWWCEAFDGSNGWAIDGTASADAALQDARDADALYGILERDVAPLFYDRDAEGIPRRWIERVRASLRTVAPRFTTGRMLHDYLVQVYRGGIGTPGAGSAPA